MIGLVLFAAAGSFVKMKLDYDSRMERLEAERREASQARTTR
jgi:hypothetical protein